MGGVVRRIFVDVSSDVSSRVALAASALLPCNLAQLDTCHLQLGHIEIDVSSDVASDVASQFEVSSSCLFPGNLTTFSRFTMTILCVPADL